jgi:hypothetical protein
MACVPTLHENKESAAYTAQQLADPTSKLNGNNAAGWQNNNSNLFK